jgi:hypothetical protein
MNTPAKEWREDIERIFKDYVFKEELKSFIQKILDQHSAYLVERIEELGDTFNTYEWVSDKCADEAHVAVQTFKEQAIDIVKDNK